MNLIHFPQNYTLLLRFPFLKYLLVGKYALPDSSGFWRPASAFSGGGFTGMEILMSFFLCTWRALSPLADLTYGCLSKRDFDCEPGVVPSRFPLSLFRRDEQSMTLILASAPFDRAKSLLCFFAKERCRRAS